MKRSFKKFLGLGFLTMVLVAMASFYLQKRRADAIHEAVAETRRVLREQGFKTDLADFNFHTDDRLWNRASTLTFLGQYPHPGLLADKVDLLPKIPTDDGIIIWKQDWLK